MGASDGTPVAIVQGGIGLQRALRAGALALDALRPAGVVVLGFAGALRADLKPGTLIVVEHTRTEVGGPGAVDIASHPRLVRAAVMAGEAADIPAARGSLVTVAAPAATPAAKAALATASGAWAVDMEAAAVAAAAAAAGLPFLAVKVVFDALDEPLDPVLMDVVRPDGSPRLLHAALLAVRDREARAGLRWAARRARGAGRVLTRFCRAFLPLAAGPGSGARLTT